MGEWVLASILAVMVFVLTPLRWEPSGPFAVIPAIFAVASVLGLVVLVVLVAVILWQERRADRRRERVDG